MITARELFEKWKATVFPGKQSELEFRSFRPFTATVYYVDKENRSCMITVDHMASDIRLAEEAAESARTLFRIASNVVVVLSSPLGMTRERGTKARATQS